MSEPRPTDAKINSDLLGPVNKPGRGWYATVAVSGLVVLAAVGGLADLRDSASHRSRVAKARHPLRRSDNCLRADDRRVVSDYSPWPPMAFLLAGPLSER